MANKHAQPFVGKTVTITKATNKTYEHQQGTIINETKNSFVIKTNDGEKTILKNGCVFNIEGTIIEGKNIMKRLEDRIKSRR